MNNLEYISRDMHEDRRTGMCINIRIDGIMNLYQVSVCMKDTRTVFKCANYLYQIGRKLNLTGVYVL